MILISINFRNRKDSYMRRITAIKISVNMDLPISDRLCLTHISSSNKSDQCIRPHKKNRRQFSKTNFRATLKIQINLYHRSYLTKNFRKLPLLQAPESFLKSIINIQANRNLPKILNSNPPTTGKRFCTRKATMRQNLWTSFARSKIRLRIHRFRISSITISLTLYWMKVTRRRTYKYLRSSLRNKTTIPLSRTKRNPLPRTIWIATCRYKWTQEELIP